VRWALDAAIVLAVGLGTLGAVFLLRDDGPAELLPDLRQLPPGAISVDELEDEHRLVFSSAVDNVGEAALVIEGRRASRTEPTMSVEQVVTRADASTRRYGVDADLAYVVAESHAHWHLLGFERYSLETAEGEVVARDRKTGFCLGDRFDSDEARAFSPARPSGLGRRMRAGRQRAALDSRGHFPWLRR
jgi:hypothetical protein